MLIRDRMRICGQKYRNNMRRKDREITDIHKIENILSNAKYLHMGILDDEYPYVVPLHYGYQINGGKLTFYVHSAKEGHKLDCIQKNDNVFVEIDYGEKLIEADVPCKYGAEYASVMCRGKAKILQNAADKCAALRILMRAQTGEEHEINEKMVNEALSMHAQKAIVHNHPLCMLYIPFQSIIV